MTVARVDQLRSLTSGTLTTSYQILGGPLAHAWRIWKITNNTNGDVLISFDGVGDNIFVPANSFTLYDIATNADQNAATALTMGIGTQFFAKYTSAPGAPTGTIYLEGIYEQGQ